MRGFQHASKILALRGSSSPSHQSLQLTFPCPACCILTKVSSRPLQNQAIFLVVGGADCGGADWVALGAGAMALGGADGRVGTERGEGGESGHAGGLGFTHHGRPQPWASLASRTFQSASFTVSTCCRVVHRPQAGRERVPPHGGPAGRVLDRIVHGSIVLSIVTFIFHINIRYRGRGDRESQRNDTARGPRGHTTLARHRPCSHPPLHASLHGRPRPHPRHPSPRHPLRPRAPHTPAAASVRAPAACQRSRACRRA